jgi:hypothetical protein
MSDPIALIQDMLSSFATPPTSTASTPSAAPATSPSSGTSSGSTPDYTLSASLANILSQGTSTGLTGNALATYNVQALMAQSQSSLLSSLPSDTSGEAAFFNQLSLYQQYLTSARAGVSGTTQGSSSATPNTLDTLLSEFNTANTNTASLSPAAQAILQGATQVAPNLPSI